MQRLYHVLPEVSAKSFLWLFVVLFLVFVLRVGGGPSQPLSFSARRGSAVASVSTPISSRDNFANVGSMTPALVGGDGRADRGDILDIPSPLENQTSPVLIEEEAPILSPVQKTNSMTAPVLTRNETQAPVVETLIPISTSVSTPAPTPASSNNSSSSSFSFFRIFGFGGGGGGGGGGGAVPEPEPAPSPAPDPTAPTSPIITSPSFPYQASTTSLIVSGTAEEGSLIEQSLSATTTSVVNGSWTISLPALAQGTTTISFTAKDAAGNTSTISSATIFVDSIAPSSPVLNAPTQNTQASTTSLIFFGTAETLSIISQNFSSATTSADTNGNWSIPLVFSEGTTTVAFTATDGLGNSSTSTSRSVFVDSIAPLAPVITSPFPLPTTASSTDLVFSGTAEPSAAITQSFSGTTTSADVAGLWSLAVSLPEGTTTIAFKAIDSLGNISVATSAQITVSLPSPPTAPIVTIAQCGAASLSADVCLSATTTLGISWLSVSGADYYTIIKNGISVATTSALSYSMSAIDKATTTITVSANNAVGSATSTEAIIEVFTRPLVVNEIAWMGTFSEVKDEWMELYNRTGRTLLLSGITLSANGFSVALSGNLFSGQLYLLERTDDDTVSEEEDGSPIAANLVYGSDVDSFDLDNAGDKITLTAQGTILDETPTIATCSGWCAGDLADAATMERVSSEVLGTVSTNWLTNGGVTFNGKDSGDEDIFGTPKQQNATGSGGPDPL